MALYRRYLTPSISSAVNSSLRNLFSSPNATTAVRSLSSLPKSSILNVNGPNSSYTWLLHPYSQNLHSVEHRGIPFYPKSLAINNIPESATRCVGSTRGWLCLADPKDRSLYLSQPFSNKSIKLPNTSKSYVFTNFTLSSSEPDSDENCILTAIKSNRYKTGLSLVYCRPGKDNARRDGPYNGIDCSFDQLVYSGYDHMFYTLNLGYEDCIRAWKVNYKSMELHNANVWFLSKPLQIRKD